MRNDFKQEGEDPLVAACNYVWEWRWILLIVLVLSGLFFLTDGH